MVNRDGEPNLKFPKSKRSYAYYSFENFDE